MDPSTPATSGAGPPGGDEHPAAQGPGAGIGAEVSTGRRQLSYRCRGRDIYYTLDLARCGLLLAATGGALHPGLRLALNTAALPAFADVTRGNLRLLLAGPKSSAGRPISAPVTRPLDLTAVPIRRDLRPSPRPAAYGDTYRR
jgi:hypothetical protein